MITFIRHAEKDGEDFTASLTEEGRNRSKWYDVPQADIVFCSTMNRSRETAHILYPNHSLHKLKILDEFDKHKESEDAFIKRVSMAIECLKLHQNSVIISHGRFMCVAYQLLTGKIVIGFDYLGSFTHG